MLYVLSSLTRPNKESKQVENAGGDIYDAKFPKKKLYELPTPRYKWGQPQEENKVIQGSLFFDLIYVGVFLQLSQAFGNAYLEDRVAAGLGIFTAQYSLVEFCWHLKIAFDARFDVEDIIHKNITILQGIAVALVANAITTVDVLETPAGLAEYGMVFSCCVMAFLLFDSLTTWELILRSPLPHVVAYGKYTLKNRLLTESLPVAMSIVLCAYEQPLYAVAIIWFATPYLSRFAFIYGRKMGMIHKENSVPMHVNWVIDRYSDFVMIALGECVVDVILVPLSIDSNYTSTFSLCYGLVAFIGLLIYRVLPTNPDHHAIRRSSTRAMLYMVSMSLMCQGIILVGVGFRIILTQSDQLPGVDPRGAWLLSISLVITLSALSWGRVLHHGFREEFLNLQGRDRLAKIGYTLGKVVSIGIHPLGPIIPGINSWQLMLFHTAFVFSLFQFTYYDSVRFRQYHLDIIQREIDLRNEEFAKQQDLVVEPLSDV